MDKPFDFSPWLDELIELRHDLHAHPELGFEEVRTSEIVANRLESWGITVDRGLGGTGVVGSLRAGDGKGAIALRADMDALAMDEMADRPYKSTYPGRMHACGHDGHTVMLLGAARLLAGTKRFSGTVHLVFQPAEEGRGGARRMIEDGFFEKFPVDMAFGLHNMPGLAPNQIAAVPGAQLASSDSWEVVFEGVGTHGAKPHLGTDAMTATGQFLSVLHTLVARRIDPLQPAVVSACSVFGGDPEAWNVIPDVVTIRGTARAYAPAVRDQIEAGLGRLAAGTAAAHNLKARYRFIRRIAPVINDQDTTEIAKRAAARAVGSASVVSDFPPTMAGDDFSEFGARVPSAYVWLGNGPAEDGALHHNSRYDFADEAIMTGISYWAAVAEEALPPG